MPLEVKEVVLRPRSRQARLDHDAVPPLRKKGTPILLRARAHRHHRKWIAEDFQYHSWPPALPGTRSWSWPWQTSCPRVCNRVCCGAGVLAELLNAKPGDTWWCSIPLLCSHIPNIDATGRAREGVARTTRTHWADITDRSCIINIDETCCKDVASARTRMARWRRTGRRHGHAPQHHRVPRHQGISCPTCMPNSFFKQDLRRGTRQPLPTPQSTQPRCR